MKTIKSKKYRILFNISKYSFVFMFMFVLIIPMIVLGDTGIVTPKPGIEPSQPGIETPQPGIETPPGVNINTNIKNPLGSKITDLSSFIKAVVEIVLVVGIPLLALAIIYAGFLFVKAQGNSEELTKAKHALLYTVIGGALLLGAFVISNAIVSTVNEIGDGV